ncbi:glycosyltransferase [Desulfococcaceae bacterium HSG9]|nr:glycosyltransferase [Desulfococcaceae bacterium HSG9]
MDSVEFGILNSECRIQTNNMQRHKKNCRIPNSEFQIDIIIVNYNSTDYLIPCLQTIYKALSDWSVNIFVQDNSDNDEVDRVGPLFPKVHITKNSCNIGFGAAVNKALKQSSAPYAVLLNPDSYIVDESFGTIFDYMQAHPDVGIVGPRIYDADGAVQGSARSFPTPLTALFGRNTLVTKLFPNNPITTANLLTKQSDGITPMEVDWVSGACMIVRRKAIEDVGYFDERFFMYWEDADWCRRMWQDGWKVVYFPKSSVVHYVGVSSKQLIPRTLIEFHKSSYRLFAKHSKSFHWIVNSLVIASLALRLCIVLIFSIPRIRLKVQPARQAQEKNTQEKAGYPEKRSKYQILRLIARLNIGGPAIHVHLLTKGLNPSRFESTLVAGQISPKEGDMSYLFDPADTNLIFIPDLQRELNLLKDIRAFSKILKIIYMKKPDIVHTHTAKAGFSAKLAVFLYNLLFGMRIKTVHTFHGHIFRYYFSESRSLIFIRIERLLAKMTDAVIAISDSQKEELVDVFKIAPSGKVKTISLGFDLHPFLKTGVLKGNFRRKFGIADDALLIGIIGRLVPIKNHRMFLDVARLFSDLNRAEKKNNVKFVIVGDGELNSELQTYCRELNLSDDVIFCGWMRDVPSVYADLDILAMTSLNEGTPVSIIEAMAASVPVIATEAGGVLDLLGEVDETASSNGFRVCQRGLLCNKNDAPGFAGGLKYMVAMDNNAKNGYIEYARQFVMQKYSQEQLLGNIESLYLELMNEECVVGNTE